MDFNFPITKPCQWSRPEHVKLTAAASDWLLQEGSLTQRLKQHAQTFQVKLLGQRPAPIFDSELALFKRHHARVPFEATVREVLLCCDDQPWVFARSLFPLSALHHKNLNLSALGTMSLGQSLFDQADLLRSPFEVTTLDTEHVISQLNQQLHGKLHPLLGRRSLFSTHNQHVLVSEIFLSPVPFYLLGNAYHPEVCNE